ncbi:sulfotransferase [Octadecabacter sp.]|nr:sulfotransferase [Octadecabacter sp.]
MAQNDIVNPIFVRGMSRSGGTLLCTLLDAHPAVSFSFELYPALLLLSEPVDLRALGAQMKKAGVLKSAAKLAPTPKFQTFINRLPRGGLDAADFGAVLIQLADEGIALTDIEGCLRAVQLCCELKQTRENTQRWGAKCNSSVNEYLEAFPAAQFVAILRDGRDVLSSQQNTGAFKPDPAGLAQSWTKLHQRFFKLQDAMPKQIMVVKYEDLTSAPIATTQHLCEFLNLRYVDKMQTFYKQDLTVFKANHLSGARISSKIDTTKIGRWREELSLEDIKTFEQHAGSALKEWGYM